jgi:DNA-binding FadR family transcriptional regulator
MDSGLLHYIVEKGVAPGDRLPALTQLSDEMGVSVGKLREELEVARQLGIVSVRPRLGIRRESYDFQPAVITSLLFALATNEGTFAQFSALRQTLETSLWSEAVRRLTPADLSAITDLVSRAWRKLRGRPAHIPTAEHRDFHLKIFCRLENPFVQGLLAAYWDAYEASELTRYVEFDHWLNVWSYHQRIAEALGRGDFDEGRAELVEHFNLLPSAPESAEKHHLLGVQ